MFDFFTYNQDIFQFIYGLIFFQLGMAIALQSRSHSRLDLARSLRWLSSFGIIHGLYEWGDIFIPIQATYLSLPIVRLLQLVHLVMLGLSFTALFQFGVALLRPFGRQRWWHGLPLSLFITWLVVVFFFLLPLIPNREAWLNTSGATARYFIGFPGGLLAAYGLRKQTRLKIAPVTDQRYIRVLSAASLALVFYAILAGLIPKPISFFPGNFLNTVSFTGMTGGIPPFMLRALAGLILTFCIIRGLEIFSLEVEQILAAMHQQQILAEERERIGRELHDGTIQKIYTAGLLVESAARKTRKDQQVFPRLERATVALNDAIIDLRHYLGELHSPPASRPLAACIKEIAEDPRYQSLVNVHLLMDVPEDTTLSPLRSDHVIAIVNGAMSNIIRHANARNVKINLSQNDGKLLDLVIQDDGTGFPQQPVNGYGLRNMSDRARQLEGKIAFNSGAEKGTVVHLTIPLEEEI